jgi:probable rRNA maturation factor
MVKKLQLTKSELSIVLTNDAQIQELNRLYRRMDRPTDVLAFAMLESPCGPRSGDLLGDVVVSVPRARLQAGERGVNVTAEITMLLAHGILHLLGWDHDTPAKDRRMRAETDRLVAAATRSSARPAKATRGVR